jgi:hypothetical protein
LLHRRQQIGADFFQVDRGINRLNRAGLFKFGEAANRADPIRNALKRPAPSPPRATGLHLDDRSDGFAGCS